MFSNKTRHEYTKPSECINSPLGPLNSVVWQDKLATMTEMDSTWVLTTAITTYLSATGLMLSAFIIVVGIVGLAPYLGNKCEKAVGGNNVVDLLYYLTSFLSSKRWVIASSMWESLLRMRIPVKFVLSIHVVVLLYSCVHPSLDYKLRNNSVGLQSRPNPPCCSRKKAIYFEDRNLTYARWITDFSKRSCEVWSVWTFGHFAWRIFLNTKPIYIKFMLL